MSEQNKPKLYKPEDIRSPWLTIFLIILIIAGFYTIFTGYWQVPFKDYLFFFLLSVAGIFWCSLLIYYNYANCIYVETTDDEITGKNKYKMKKEVIKFSEIKEMWITKVIFVIHLKDIHGKKLGILFRDEFIPLLGEVLEKSENCTRIDLNYDYFIKQNYPQLSDIKPLLDKRLAEIKERENELRSQSNGTVV